MYVLDSPFYSLHPLIFIAIEIYNFKFKRAYLIKKKSPFNYTALNALRKKSLQQSNPIQCNLISHLIFFCDFLLVQYNKFDKQFMIILYFTLCILYTNNHHHFMLFFYLKLNYYQQYQQAVREPRKCVPRYLIMYPILYMRIFILVLCIPF